MRTPALSNRGRDLVTRRVRYYHALIALVTVMFAAELTVHFTRGTASAWLVAVVAVVATALALGSGLTFADLGLSRATLGRGLRYSAVIVAVTVAAIAVGLAVEPIRELFRNEAYTQVGAAVFASLVLIPLQTVIAEELLFRGVLFGALLRRHSARTALIVQALLFGLWHVLTSLGLSEGNEGVGDAVGRGPVGVALGVLAAVLFTTVAGLFFGWLRLRTGSILPAIALHWAANGAGAVAAALAWQLP